jgi:integrase
VILSSLVEEWVSVKVGTVTERTLDGYKALLDRYVIPTLGGRRVSELTTRDIQKLYGDMRMGNHPAVATKSKQPKVKTGHAVGALVVRHTNNALHQVLDQAVEWNLVSRNPVDLLKRKLPKVSHTKRRVFDREEATAFLRTCAGMTHGLIFEFALLSGMRPEEFLALQWRDLNF